MNIKGNNSISKFVKIALKILFCFGIVVILFLPIVVKEYTKILGIEQNYIWVLIIMYISGIPAEILIYQFIKLFESLQKEKPFVRENVKHLKISSVVSLIIAIEYLLAITIFKSIFTIIICGVFLIAWLGLYILAELFQEAIQYKEENDLTI